MCKFSIAPIVMGVAHPAHRAALQAMLVMVAVWSAAGLPAAARDLRQETVRAAASMTKAPVSRRSFPSRSGRAAATTLTFDATCVPGRRAVIAAVGDLLFHDVLQAQALRPGASFRDFWAPVATVLEEADLTYGNLESPIAHGVRAGGHAHPDPGRRLDGVVYGRRGGALIFNTHPAVARDLAASGFDVVSTANNHAADRGSLGMDRSLSALDDAGLAHTGVRRADADTAAPWSTRTTTANGITIAWLACTYGLNGLPDPKGQVLHCHRDLPRVLAEIRSVASAPAVDAVILTPHWGAEGTPQAQPADRGFARLALDAGASAVVGTHPHVLQPWEKYIAADGRETLIIYSTGNFVSNQQTDDQRTGVIALLEVTKPDDGAPARLSAAGYVPTYVAIGARHRVGELRHETDSLRRLPAGNRVTAGSFRALPRACAPSLSELVGAGDVRIPITTSSIVTVAPGADAQPEPMDMDLEALSLDAGRSVCAHAGSHVVGTRAGAAGGSAHASRVQRRTSQSFARPLPCLIVAPAAAHTCPGHAGWWQISSLGARDRW